MHSGVMHTGAGAPPAFVQSVETVLADTVVGVGIALVLFAAYYVLVLRRAQSQR